MKKNYIYILSMSLGIMLGSASISNAAATFQSSGKIKYTDQATGNTVVFDSEDFNTIENNITTGKNNILQSLQDIKTYLDADGNVVQYEPPDSSYSGTPEFDKLAEAVSKSQEVPALSSKTVTDKDGNKLYYKSEEAMNNKNIMESTTTDPGFSGAEIKGYAPATADNLTAGSAAWVDGELILGNGSNNTDYYEQGKLEGFPEIKLKIRMVTQLGSQSSTYKLTIPEGYNRLKFTDNGRGDSFFISGNAVTADTPYDITPYAGTELEFSVKSTKDGGDYCITDYNVHIYRENE